MSTLNRYFPSVPGTEVDIAQQLMGEFKLSLEEANKVIQLTEGLECYTTIPKWEEPLGYLDSELPIVSQEGFVDFLKEVWESLKRWFSKVLEWFKQFTNQVKIETTAIRLKANNIRIYARNEITKTITKKDPLIMNTHVASLSVLYNQPRDMVGLINWLGMLHKTLSGYYEYTDKTALKGVKGLVNTFQSIDPVTLSNEELERKIIEPVNRFTPSELIKHLGNTKQQSPTVIFGPQMLGNVRFRFDLPPESHAHLRKLNEYKVSMTTAELTPRAMPPQLVIPRFTLQNNDQALDRVIELCDLLDESTKVNEERDRVINNLTKAIERLVDKAYKIPNGNPSVKENAEQLLRLSRQITQWITPYPGAAGSALRAMRGTLILCEKNLK